MAGEAPVHALVYNSDAVREFRDDELRDLLFHARRRNAECGISGMLVYAGGNFVQYIEGDRAATEASHRHLERGARPQRGLLEDHGERPPAQYLARSVTLHAQREIQEAGKFGGRYIEDRGEVATEHGRLRRG